MNNRQQVIDWTSQLIKDLADKPEDLSVKATVDEKGLLITVYAPKGELGRLIGRQGATAEALRTIVNIYGFKYGARSSLKIDDATK
jgi:uncharacterized protein